MVTQNGLVRIVEQVAAEQVAGSMLRVMVGDETYLFEAGSEMTHGKKPFPLTPEQIKALQNTTFGHGHGDHILRTLELIAKGFNGKFYSTHQTAAIAKIQFREEASGPFIHNKMVAGKTFQYGPKKGQPLPKQPFEFRSEDVNAAMAMFASLDGQEPGFPYETDIEIGDGVTIKFYEAGHIPGAAQTMYKISKGGKKINVLFAYDLGRTDYKILGHPVADIPLVKFPTTDFDEQIDYIVIEATYGNRIHRPLQESLTALTEAAREAEKNKGVLVIPAFSIMRTQMLWNFLFELEQKGQLPDDMIFYSSSPMADQVARIMLSHKEDFNRQAMAEFQSANDNPFYFPKLVHQKTGKETAETIAELMGKTPIGVIASSGMCDMGRIIPILEQTISDPRNVVLLTGYCAPGTRADMMKKGQPKIPFTDQEVELKAKVMEMGGLSGHADCVEMLAHLNHLFNNGRNPPKGIYIKHGDKAACWALRDEIIKAGYSPDIVHVMQKGEEYQLN